MKNFILTIVIVGLIVGVGFMIIRRRKPSLLPASMAKPVAPPMNTAQKLENLVSSKTGVPLAKVGHAYAATESTLWNSGAGGKIGAVALAPILEPTAAIQKAIDDPKGTAKYVVNSLQTGASSVGHAIIGSPPAVANVVASGAVATEHAVVGAAKSVGSAAKSVGKKILSIF